MKKYLLLFAAFTFIAASMMSCGGGSSTPKEVAIDFTKKLNSLDFEGAKKLGTPETAKMLDMLSTFAAMMPDSVKNETKNLKVEAKDEKIDGDKAEVNIVNGDKGEEKINLVKQDGNWKVHMSKDNMGNEGAAMPAENTEMPTPEDTTSAPAAPAETK